jgi:uncharacterized membrane protein
LDIKNTVGLVATFGVGLLAGILVGTGLVALTARGLSEPAWVTQFQLEDQLFARAMPPFMLSTLVLLIAACVLARGHSRWAFGMSVVFMLLVLAVTIRFEVPLNKQIQSWTSGSAPPEWQHVRDLWLQRHLLRTIASILAFITALIALVD